MQSILKNRCQVLLLPPFVPKDGDELKDALVTNKRSLLPFDKRLTIYIVAVGHRRDISWEEKREADFQPSLKKWTQPCFILAGGLGHLPGHARMWDLWFRFANSLGITSWARRLQR